MFMKKLWNKNSDVIFLILSFINFIIIVIISFNAQNRIINNNF